MNATGWLQGLRTQEGLLALGARVPQYATVALVLAIAAQAAIIVADYAAAPRRGSGVPGGAGAAPPVPGRRGLDIGSLVNAHLFGSAALTAASGADAAHAPATNLALVLAGVLAAEEPDRGLAILGEAAATAKVYTVGQNVPGGAKLHAVYDDRVILDRNGALESLLLPRGTTGAQGRGPLVAMAAPAANPIDTMRRVISDNPGAVGEILRPTPVLVNNKLQGYRIYPGRNRGAFSHLGLQAGDLVTAVNGTPLDDPNRGNEILGTLSSSTEAHITVTRNGRSQDLVLNLSQVASEAEQTLGPAGARGMEAPPTDLSAGGGSPTPTAGTPAGMTPATDGSGGIVAGIAPGGSPATAAGAPPAGTGGLPGAAPTSVPPPATVASETAQ
jgi:general secretion pathway protein C